MNDLLLQVMATQQGITGLHAAALQRGGVALEVVSCALSYGWQNLQQQQRQLADVRAVVCVILRSF